MSSYYQKINTLYKRDMTKPKKPIILGEYSESEFEVLKDLKKLNSEEYANGRILNPLTSKTYSVKATLISNGKRLQLRGYVGVSALGRSQTWIREN